MDQIQSPRRLQQGHHIEGGRNTTSQGGTAGRDVFHAAVQMSRMPMCLSDPSLPDNPMIFCNRAFEQLTGYEEAEIVGRNCRFLQGPRTDRDVVSRIRGRLDAGEDVHETILNYRKDGSAYWSALYISPVLDASGALKYFFGSQIDITRQREAELLMQQSQRMETLGSIASSVAHEFNNLMTVVLAGIERSLPEGDPERRVRSLARAEWGARRAAKLTDQMLSFTRRQFHDRQPHDLNELLAGIEGLAASVADGGRTLDLRLSPDPAPVEVDAGQLEIALLNLIRNASQATQPGSAIVVQAMSRPDTVLVEVRDAGVGMPQEVLQRASEPFYTARTDTLGAGLGLSMVRGFAEQSGGRLELESEPGRGTTARIVLPART